jgi:hypothetical protein
MERLISEKEQDQPKANVWGKKYETTDLGSCPWT